VISPDRAATFAAAETILAHANSAADARISGQGGLFGDSASNVVPIRMPSAQRWSLVEQMAQEKESFGFYFSAHPVDRYRHLIDAHGARTYAQLLELPAPADGGRSGAVMAGLVEEARWRTSAKGRRYMMATLSDASGPFTATVFDDMAAAQMEEAAKNGGCGLLNVELDRRPGDEVPRVTIKSIQPFEELAQRSRLQIEVEVDRPEALAALARLVAGERGGKGQIRLRANFGSGEAQLVLGRDYHVDAEMQARIEQIDGVVSVALSVVQQRLALVA
jgi:DNA polymerase III subunit alpha